MYVISDVTVIIKSWVSDALIIKWMARPIWSIIARCLSQGHISLHRIPRYPLYATGTRSLEFHGDLLGKEEYNANCFSAYRVTKCRLVL